MSRKEQSEALAEQWRRHIAAWKASDQSQAAYCEANSLSYHRFGYWYRKFCGTGKSSGAGFAKVSRQPFSHSPGLSLVLPSGVVLQGIESTNLPVVYQLVSRLA